MSLKRRTVMAKKGKLVILFAGMLSLLFLTSSMEVWGEIKKISPVPAIKQQVSGMTPAAEVRRIDISLNDIHADQQDCQLWVGWKNAGNTKIDAHLVETVYVDGVFLATSTNHVVLDPGAYFNHEVGTGYKVQGTKSVTAKIDATDVLKESNETNNSMTKTVACEE